MADIQQLIQLMKLQEDQRQQREAEYRQRQEEQRQQQEEQRQQQEERMEENRKLMEFIVQGAQQKQQPAAAIPAFNGFDPTVELLMDYMDRFNTFAAANSIPDDRAAGVFLTNQQPTLYKQLSNMGAQLATPKQINTLTMDEIEEFLKEQYDPKRFIVRERYKYWSDMQRKPGETIQELAARIRQDATTCAFTDIRDPLDEALRTRFICSVNNEAVLKSFFKIKDDELNFNKAIHVAQETEDAARVAKETVYGKQTNVNKVTHQKGKKSSNSSTQFTQKDSDNQQKKPCHRCDRTNHTADQCRFKTSVCNFCSKTGHIERACIKKKKTTSKETSKAHKIEAILHRTQRNTASIPQLHEEIQLRGQAVTMELDTGACDNFISQTIWSQLGGPQLQETSVSYKSASGHAIETTGQCQIGTKLPYSQEEITLPFVVSTVPDLNLLGRVAIQKLRISIDDKLNQRVSTISEDLPDLTLQKDCKELCSTFPDIFKEELGCLKDYQLEINFKSTAKPVFCRPRPVPYALLEDLNQTYDAGIAKGIWEPTQFNEYGTPVVPIRKARLPGQTRGKIRVCGDYSKTVNPQLEIHRQPIPLPEHLIRRLGGGYGFTKIDLADAYNQISLAPESQKKLALSTHRGVLRQKRLPFGISSAPGYFQEIMEQLTQDLPGVAVYLDDILVSGSDASSHLHNLSRLLQRLTDRGLRCRQEKCCFAQPTVEYLGHKLTTRGVAKGVKADAIQEMPPPTTVTELRSFLGSTQFYSKFMPNLSAMTTPLHKLTRKGEDWRWGAEQEESFKQIKERLATDQVLAHYDPTLDIGISCDASNSGLGAVLFHRYPDGSERPVANVSKTLTNTQKKYGQIQKEALSIIFGLKKFHQFLYGRQFILVTDHRPLLALFGPTKGVPALAANRLARWALLLGQYDYSIEYRATKDHQNADALSRLPVGPDAEFDQREDEEDVDTVCTIHSIGQQLSPTDPGVLAKETRKDPILAAVMRYTAEGWPTKPHLKETSTTMAESYRKIAESLSTAEGCLLYGTRVVIPLSLQRQVLQILHLGHFGMERMKKLARTAVYWPRIDSDIEEASRQCTSCAEHQRMPQKYPVHPWMIPEKPWSRLHLDHAVNFMGSNWLVMIDAYSKYPCIHRTSSTSTKATTDILDEEFAHFGYPHSIVTDNATTFTSTEFQKWCQERGIVHLTGAPYHPATNGAAERLVQSFKQALKKSSQTPKAALQQFLMHYRRTPLPTGYSPSQLLNGRQIRCKIDILLPSPAHMAQQLQARETRKSSTETISRIHQYIVGAACYALYQGPRHNRQSKWVPATVTKVYGTRSMNVRVVPRGPTWRRHVEQLRPRYSSDEDNNPGDTPDSVTQPDPAPTSTSPTAKAETAPTPSPPRRRRRNPRLPDGDEYGPDNPRRSKRSKRTKCP
jgi:hypothetical protein